MPLPPKRGKTIVPLLNRNVYGCLANGERVIQFYDKLLILQNWYNEINKWLKGKLNALAIDSGTKSQIDSNLKGFMMTVGRRPVTPVLIISYETFRVHAHVLHQGEVGLVLCDEVRI